MSPKPKILNQSIPIRLNTKWGGLEKDTEVLECCNFDVDSSFSAQLPNNLSGNLEIKGEGHKKVTNCKKFKYSILHSRLNAENPM